MKTRKSFLNEGTRFYAFKEYGSYYGCDNGVLLGVAMLSNGEPDNDIFEVQYLDMHTHEMLEHYFGVSIDSVQIESTEA